MAEVEARRKGGVQALNFRLRYTRDTNPGTSCEQVIVQVTKLGTLIGASPAIMDVSRNEFARQHYLLVPQFLAPDLAKAVVERLRDEDFYERTHEGIGVELCLARGPLSATLEFLANDPNLFSFVEYATGCPPIGCLQGRVYRLNPGGDHYDSWHSDLGEDRLVAISVNLSPEPYSGGALQIRETVAGGRIQEIANVGFGDAVIFQIAQNLRHRVLPVSGGTPRTAYAGWFRARPSYEDLLAARLSSSGPSRG